MLLNKEALNGQCISNDLLVYTIFAFLKHLQILMFKYSIYVPQSLPYNNNIKALPQNTLKPNPRCTFLVFV